MISPLLLNVRHHLSCTDSGPSSPVVHPSTFQTCNPTKCLVVDEALGRTQRPESLRRHHPAPGQLVSPVKARYPQCGSATLTMAQTLAPSSTPSARSNAISWPAPSSATRRAADEAQIRRVGTPNQRNVGSTIGREVIRFSNEAGSAPATITKMAATVSWSKQRSGEVGSSTWRPESQR
jgi:hypothetical protein